MLRPPRQTQPSKGATSNNELAPAASQVLSLSREAHPSKGITELAPELIVPGSSPSLIRSTPTTNTFPLQSHTALPPRAAPGSLASFRNDLLDVSESRVDLSGLGQSSSASSDYYDTTELRRRISSPITAERSSAHQGETELAPLSTQEPIYLFASIITCPLPSSFPPFLPLSLPSLLCLAVPAIASPLILNPGTRHFGYLDSEQFLLA